MVIPRGAGFVDETTAQYCAQTLPFQHLDTLELDQLIRAVVFQGDSKSGRIVRGRNLTKSDSELHVRSSFENRDIASTVDSSENQVVGWRSRCQLQVALTCRGDGVEDRFLGMLQARRWMHPVTVFHTQKSIFLRRLHCCQVRTRHRIQSRSTVNGKSPTKQSPTKLSSTTTLC